MLRTEFFRHNQGSTRCQHAHINIQIACKGETTLAKNDGAVVHAENTILLWKKVRLVLKYPPQKLALASAATGHDAHAGLGRNLLYLEVLIFTQLRGDNRSGRGAAIGHKLQQLPGDGILVDKHRRLAKAHGQALLHRPPL